ncbi:MAG: endonuclease/exonuclease/phosphatase family protein, partial [Candidatus Hodarchaeales archaeon]
SFFGRNYSDLVLISLIFLFSLELISDFVEAIYALCLLTLSLNENILGVIFFFSPILILLVRKPSKKALILILITSGELIVVCRVLEAFFIASPQLKMIIAGLGVGSFLVFLPTFLVQKSNGDADAEQSAITIVLGLMIALILSIFFRTIGSTIDISTHGIYQVIGWFLAVITTFLMIGLFVTEKEKKISEKPDDAILSSSPDSNKVVHPISAWKLTRLTLGVISIIIIVYFAFISPTVISRWTEGDYMPIVLVLIVILSIFALIALFKPDLMTKIKPWLIWTWNGLFVLALVLTILAHQLPFPTSPGDYPYTAPPVTIIHLLPLLLMLILSPVILIDFTLLSRELIKGKSSINKLAGSFTIGSLFFLLMIFAQVFTTTYDYIDVVGPIFRDKFWLVFTVIGIFAVIPVILVNRSSHIFKKPQFSLQNQITAVLIGIIAIGTIAGVIVTTPSPPVPDVRTSIKVLTYNIQQGYNEDGIKNFDGQLNILREVDADIIGLQECDTARIANGNGDVVRYFANSLNLHSYYGPTTTVGTFGISLLSKYPILNAQTFYMYSEGEQTATIKAQVQIGTTLFNVYVTHLGNGGPIVQQEAIMDEISGENNVILMGDFNFRPFTEQYNLTTTILDDSWLLQWPTGVDDLAYNASSRIDHVFVSSGISISDCRFIDSPESDHPALWVKIDL